MIWLLDTSNMADSGKGHKNVDNNRNGTSKGIKVKLKNEDRAGEIGDFEKAKIERQRESPNERNLKLKIVDLDEESAESESTSLGSAADDKSLDGHNKTMDTEPTESGNLFGENCLYDGRDELLIALVKAYPFLYDPSSKEFKNPQIRENAWRAIASATGSEVNQTQKRWTSLRQQYSRYRMIKRKSITGESTGRKPRWYLGELLTWMDPYMQSRSTFTRTKRTHYLTRHVQKAVEQPKESTSSSSSSASSCSTWEPSFLVSQPYSIAESGNLQVMLSLQNTPNDSSTAGQHLENPSTQNKNQNTDSANGTVQENKTLQSSTSKAMPNMDDIDEDYLFLQSLLLPLKRLSKLKRYRAKQRLLEVVADFDADEDN